MKNIETDNNNSIYKISTLLGNLKIDHLKNEDDEEVTISIDPGDYLSPVSFSFNPIEACKMSQKILNRFDDKNQLEEFKDKIKIALDTALQSYYANVCLLGPEDPMTLCVRSFIINMHDAIYGDSLEMKSERLKAVNLPLKPEDQLSIEDIW